QAEDVIRDPLVTGVQTCALPISAWRLLHSAPGRPRRGRDQGRGHRPGRLRPLGAAVLRLGGPDAARHPLGDLPGPEPQQALDPRSEERRVGKECRSWWWAWRGER